MEYLEKAKAKLKDQFWSSPLEKKLNQAVSDDNYGVTFQSLQEIADLCHSPIDYPGKEWKKLYKALCLLEVLIKQGPDSVIDDCQTHMFFIKSLCEFTYNDQGIERGTGDKSDYIVDLLVQPDKLNQEKENAKQFRKKKRQEEQQGEGFENEEQQQYAKSEAKSDSGIKASLQNIASRITEITSDTVQNLGEKYKDIKNTLNEKIYGVSADQGIQEMSDSSDFQRGTHYGGYIEQQQQPKVDQNQGNLNSYSSKQKIGKIQKKEDSRAMNPLMSSKSNQQVQQQQKKQAEQIDFLNFLEVPYQEPNPSKQDLLSQNVSKQQQKIDIFNDFGQQQPQPKPQQNLDLFALQPQQNITQTSQQQNIDLFSFQPTQQRQNEAFFQDLIGFQEDQTSKPKVDLFKQQQFPQKNQVQVQSFKQEEDIFEDFVEAPQQVETKPQQKIEKPSKIQEDIFDLFNESTQNQKVKSETKQQQPDLFQAINPQQKTQQNVPMGSFWETHYQKQNVQTKQKDFDLFQQQPQKQSLQMPQQQNTSNQSSQGQIDFLEFTQPQKQQGPMKSTPPPAKVPYKAQENSVKEKKDLMNLFEDFKI